PVNAFIYTLSLHDALPICNVIANDGPSFTIKANRSWTLKIKSQNAANWTYAGSNSGVKPISDLSWSTSAGGTFVAITNSDAAFADRKSTRLNSSHEWISYA